MSEKLAIIEESILQDTADAIRSKNNTTSKIEPKDFKSNILNISGGEDVSAETTQYTSLLADLETAIDALPDASSGGGEGTALETCTVTIEHVTSANGNGFIPEGVFSTLSNGMIVPIIVSDVVIIDVDGKPGTGGGNQVYRQVIQNVIKGTSVVLTNQGTDWEYSFTTSGDIEILECYFGFSDSKAFQINGDCQISFADV